MVYSSTPFPQTLDPVYRLQNIGLKYTHCTNVPFLWPMYVVIFCIPDDLKTSLAAGVAHFPSMFLCDLFPMICLRKLICVTYAILVITSNTAHDYNPKSIPFFEPLPNITLSTHGYLNPPVAVKFAFPKTLLSLLMFWKITIQSL